MADLAGRRLGNYELVERVGSGGMAEVYRARQLTAFGRDVAIKVIHPQFSSDETFRARFLREAQAISRLSHPNILPLIEFGEENETLYLVMPLIPDGTLRDLLKQQQGPLPLQESLPLFTQLCAAVQAAHEQGIIHRDIKPQNVLLQQRHVLLSDFGVARDQRGQHITSVGAGLGTAEYMAPEQAIGHADRRSDIYSLGIVLYLLLTGLLPYQGNTPLELVVKHSNEPPPDPRRLNPALPGQIVAVIETALAKNPDQRFQSAQALSRATQQALADHVSASAIQPAVSSLQPALHHPAQSLLSAREQQSAYSTQARPSVFTTRQTNDIREQHPVDGFLPAFGAQPARVAAPPAPTPPTAKSKKLGLAVLLALLALGVILSAGLVALSLSGKGPFATLGKHPTPAPTATPLAPPGFLLYTNPDHSFKIIYPKTWKKSASLSGVGVHFDGTANSQGFDVENGGATQADLAMADDTFCLLLSGSPGTPEPVTIGAQRWTRETCDSPLNNLHVVIEAINYKGDFYLMSYSSTPTTFARDQMLYFSLMEKSFTFLV